MESKKRKSRARPRYKQTVYSDVRRTLSRRLRFTPDEETANLFGYVLGLATQKYEVRLSAFCIMATHPHILVTDKGGNYSGFKQYVNSNLALALNQRHNISGQFWDNQRVEGERILLDPIRGVESLTYMMLNPVKRLVDDWRDWRDLKLLGGPEEWGKPLMFQRPPWRFANSPERVTLTLEPIPNVDRSVEDLIDWIDRRQELERLLREPVGLENAQSRHQFEQSRDEILMWAHSPDGEAFRLETLRHRARLGRECRLFQSVDLQAVQSARDELDEFEVDHSSATHAFCTQDREATFPVGTNKMRTFNVNVAVSEKPPTPTMLVTGNFAAHLRGPPLK